MLGGSGCGRWKRGPAMLDLARKSALIVGLGGAGAEAARLCAAFDMTVTGIDPPCHVADRRSVGPGDALSAGC
jgi:phosphoglycerate dehydrogenase-like enzyme